jgi:hypothetical protein
MADAAKAKATADLAARFRSPAGARPDAPFRSGGRDTSCAPPSWLPSARWPPSPWSARLAVIARAIRAARRTRVMRGSCVNAARVCRAPLRPRKSVTTTATRAAWQRTRARRWAHARCARAPAKLRPTRIAGPPSGADPRGRARSSAIAARLRATRTVLRAKPARLLAPASATTAATASLSPTRRRTICRVERRHDETPGPHATISSSERRITSRTIRKDRHRAKTRRYFPGSARAKTPETPR